MKEKVVLAYSGGLDTTAIIPWLKENFDYEVICCCIDCGQGEELDGLEERAKLSGASKLYIENIIDEFCDDFIIRCFHRNNAFTDCSNFLCISGSICCRCSNCIVTHKITDSGAVSRDLDYDWSVFH